MYEISERVTYFVDYNTYARTETRFVFRSRLSRPRYLYNTLGPISGRPKTHRNASFYMFDVPV